MPTEDLLKPLEKVLEESRRLRDLCQSLLRATEPSPDPADETTTPQGSNADLDPHDPGTGEA